MVRWTVLWLASADMILSLMSTFPVALPSLPFTSNDLAIVLPRRLVDHNQCAVRTGDAAVDENQIPFRVNPDDLEALLSDGVSAHAAGPARSLENTLRT